MTNAKKVKIGMVGVRHYAAVRRNRLKQTGFFEIAAAYNRTMEYALELEKKEGIKAVSSYEELLETPGLEAVAVCSGAKFHAEQTLQALEHGLHVFVEKPLCSTPDEMRAILAAQKRSGLVVALGHEDHFHDPVSIKIKEMIDSGQLGKIAAFEKTTAHSGGLMIKPGDWRGDPNANPGGMLFQCGVHSFHELMHYFGPIDEITALMRYDVHTTATADVALCQMKFKNGLIGTLSAYHVTPYRHTFNLYGTKANLYRNERFFDEGTSMFMQETRCDGKKEPCVPVDIDDKADNCASGRSFYRAIRFGEKASPSLGDGARAVAAVFAAEESAKTGKPVKIQHIEN